jgi:hypothetical protein
MKAYGGVDVYIHVYLTLALAGGEWLASRPGRFIPGKRAPWYSLDTRLGRPQNRSGRRGEEKILDPTGTRTLNPGRPARSQSLYRLRYPSFTNIHGELNEIPWALCTRASFRPQHDFSYCWSRHRPVVEISRIIWNAIVSTHSFGISVSLWDLARVKLEM